MGLLGVKFSARKKPLNEADLGISLDRTMVNESHILGWYVVSFLDVLGQREKFQQLRLPRTPEEYAIVQEVMKDTAGFVLGLRKIFRDQFESFAAGLQSSSPGTERIQVPDFQGFSDSLIASVALRSEDNRLTPNVRIFSTLVGACIATLTALAKKHAIRGGIDVGLCTELCPGEIYGEALARAYILESKEAGYPRVLIGDELFKYLSFGLLNTQQTTTAIVTKEREIIRKSLGLITVDSDGKRILDYLGHGIAGLGISSVTNTLVRAAYQFVLEEHERLLSNGNNKLSGRYENLRRYFELRLPLWWG